MLPWLTLFGALASAGLPPCEGGTCFVRTTGRNEAGEIETVRLAVCPRFTDTLAHHKPRDQSWEARLVRNGDPKLVVFARDFTFYHRTQLSEHTYGVRLIAFADIQVLALSRSNRGPYGRTFLGEVVAGPLRGTRIRLSHLSDVTSGLQAGDVVREGETLGGQGGSGFGDDLGYRIHVHAMSTRKGIEAFLNMQVCSTCLLELEGVR